MGTESTNLEALTAEMLGDIGKLHDSVVKLKVELPAALEPARKIPGELIAAAKKAKEEYEAITIAAEKHAKVTIERVAAETLVGAAEKAFGDGVQKYTEGLEHAAVEKSAGRVAMVGGAVLLAGILLGGGFTYFGQMFADKSALENAIATAAAATEAKVKAEAGATAAIAAATVSANAKAEAEVKQLRASAGWLGTADGQLAYKFFTKGGGKSAATCDADLHWEKFKMDDGRNLCVPMRPGRIYGWASGETGWLIP